MASQPDLVVFSPDHQLVLVVEVKTTPKVDEQWAAKLRRNLLAHGALPPAPYFLLVLPDHLYLWSQPDQSPSELPNFRADTKKVLQRYLKRWQLSDSKQVLTERGLELAVASWLRDLTTPDHWSSSDT